MCGAYVPRRHAVRGSQSLHLSIVKRVVGKLAALRIQTPEQRKVAMQDMMLDPKKALKAPSLVSRSTSSFGKLLFSFDEERICLDVDRHSEP